jgi:hypothetical protein
MAKPPVSAFKKGHKKLGGRKAGKRNSVTRDMKEALLAAAENIGFIHEDDVLDENGKPTPSASSTPASKTPAPRCGPRGSTLT